MSSQVAERIPQQTIEAAKAVSVLSLAEQHSELRRASGREAAGPCPKCGGSNRFHVTEEWFFCRQCHSKRGDAIEFVRWLSPGLSFADAVSQLAGSLPSSPPAKAPAKRKPERQQQTQPAAWREKAERLVAEAHERLWRKEGEPGQVYLERRGLEPATWLAYGMGYRQDAPLPGTHGKMRAPAIVLPWRSASLGVFAVRYRFLEEQRYTDSDGKERAEKLVAETGSQFASKLFGGQVLPAYVQMAIPEGHRPAEARRALVIVEGELNAASIWQVCGGDITPHDLGIDVLSLGSESARLSPAAVQFAQRYGAILAWADRAEVAREMAAALPGAHPIRSPLRKDAAGNVLTGSDGKPLKIDANDMLRAGMLGGFLATVRADAAKSAGELEALYWALCSAADTLSGLDATTAQVAMSMAAKMGKRLELVEAEPDRWITAKRLR